MARNRKSRNPPPIPQFICPCCDYVTLSERGRHEICPICFWEDEDVYYHIDPNEPSMANHGFTLTDARKNFATIGACDPNMLPHVLSEDDRAEFLHFPLKP